MSNLAVQIRDLNRIAVHEADCAHTSAGKIRSSRTPQSSNTNKQHFGILQPQLSVQADLRQNHLPSISLVLFAFERPAAMR